MFVGLFVLCGCIGEPSFSKLSTCYDKVEIRTYLEEALKSVNSFYREVFGDSAGEWI